MLFSPSPTLLHLIEVAKFFYCPPPFNTHKRRSPFSVQNCHGLSMPPPRPRPPSPGHTPDTLLVIFKLSPASINCRGPREWESSRIYLKVAPQLLVLLWPIWHPWSTVKAIGGPAYLFVTSLELVKIVEQDESTLFSQNTTRPPQSLRQEASTGIYTAATACDSTPTARSFNPGKTTAGLELPRG